MNAYNYSTKVFNSTDTGPGLSYDTFEKRQCSLAFLFKSYAFFDPEKALNYVKIWIKLIRFSLLLFLLRIITKNKFEFEVQ